MLSSAALPDELQDLILSYHTEEQRNETREIIWRASNSILDLENEKKAIEKDRGLFSKSALFIMSIPPIITYGSFSQAIASSTERGKNLGFTALGALGTLLCVGLAIPAFTITGCIDLGRECKIKNTKKALDKDIKNVQNKRDKELEPTLQEKEDIYQASFFINFNRQPRKTSYPLNLNILIGEEKIRADFSLSNKELDELGNQLLALNQDIYWHLNHLPDKTDDIVKTLIFLREKVFNLMKTMNRKNHKENAWYRHLAGVELRLFIAAELMITATLEEIKEPPQKKRKLF